MTWLTQRLRQQSAHSLYLTLAALLFVLTLAPDPLFSQRILNPAIVGVLILVCLAASVAAFLYGDRVPRWIGLGGALVFVAAQGYFLGIVDDPQTVVAATLQMPIMAFYLGWFVRPGAGIPILALGVLVFGIAMLSNPLLGPEGVMGPRVVTHGMLSLVFGYAVGLYLWRRHMRVAVTDPLTGVLNRRGFMERLEARLRRRGGRRGVLSVVAIDFDGFKRLNDLHGHAAGDTVLVSAVDDWRAVVRSGDVIGRVGGDEFVLLLPGVGLAECAGVVGRLREGMTHAWSWGAVEAVPGEGPEELLARADGALYAHKRLRAGGTRG